MPEHNQQSPGPIASRTIGNYLDMLASSSPTPGGGSAAGVIGALGAGLARMVVSLTTSDDAGVNEQLAAVVPRLDELRSRFPELAEADETVYQGYRAAAAMPKSSSWEKAQRRDAMQTALKDAATVPLDTCQAAVELAEAIVPVRTFGNRHLQSDASIAAVCASACFEASRLNVNINLAMIRDDAWTSDAANRLASLAEAMQEHPDAAR